MPPTEFIPVAEETGLIRQVGQLVLRKACRSSPTGAPAGSSQGQVTVSVNVSGRQLVEPELTADITSALRAERAPPRSAAARDHRELDPPRTGADPGAAGSARAPRGRAQIDDFGTGYSSLSFLRRFPGDALKIDRSFVRSILQEDGSEEIVRAIIGLAQSLNLGSIAEGVEDHAQLKILHSLGCQLRTGLPVRGALAPGCDRAPDRRVGPGHQRRGRPPSSGKRSPQLGRRAFRREHVQLHAGRHLEAGADPDPGGDVEVPVELIRPAGAVKVQALSWGTRSKRASSASRAVRSIPTPTSPSRSKLGAGERGMIRSSNGERDAQGQISRASSSMATRRSRRRTSSEAISANRSPPIVCWSYEANRSRSRATAAGTKPSA